MLAPQEMPVVKVEGAPLSWKKEFAHMAGDDIDAMVAQLPQGFEDISYHHETCPRFAKLLPNGDRVCVWIDAEKPDDREVANSRFSVHLLSNEYEPSGHVLDSDVIGEVVAAVERLFESKSPL